MNKELLALINSELEDGEFGVLCTVTEESINAQSKGASDVGALRTEASAAR